MTANPDTHRHNEDPLAEAADSLTPGGGLSHPEDILSRTMRLDPRYVSSDDPRAMLRAWGGPDATMDMGGWTDEDRTAFTAAVQDESLHSAGERLDRVVIEAVTRA